LFFKPVVALQQRETRVLPAQAKAPSVEPMHGKKSGGICVPFPEPRLTVE